VVVASVPWACHDAGHKYLMVVVDHDTRRLVLYRAYLLKEGLRPIFTMPYSAAAGYSPRSSTTCPTA
jgi:hypothetical protein